MSNPNNNGTLNAALIAQEALSLLSADYPIISSIATDFSSEPVLAGQQVISRIPSIGVVQDFDDVNGYVPASGTMTDVSFTLGSYRHATFAVTDRELSSTTRNLVAEYSKSFAEALGQDLMLTIANLFTTGNFSYATTQSLTGINRSTVIAANAALSSRNVGKKNRFGIITPSVAAQLWNDPTVVYLTAGGTGITASQLPKIADIDFTEYSALPNTSNLVGVIGTKDALVVAARTPSQAGYADLPLNGRISQVTDPKTGLTVRVSEEYQISKGRRIVSFSWIFGAGVGNPVALQRIVTA
jgi:hypothetical protein